MGDAVTHGAGADDGGCVDLAHLDLRIQAGDAGGFAFAEEDVAQGARFIGVFELVEEVAFALEAFGEGQFGGGLDGEDAVVGRLLVAGAAGDFLALCVEDAGVGLRFLELVGAGADLREGAGVCLGAGVGNGGLLEVLVVFHDGVDDAKREGFGGGDVAAGHDEV